VNNEPQYLENDLKGVVSKHIFGIMLPKVETVENLKEVDGILAGLEKERGLEPDSIKLFIMIETALGLFAVMNWHPPSAEFIPSSVPLGKRAICRRI